MDGIFGDHLPIMGGGPLGAKEWLGLSSSRLGETRGHGPFVPVGEAYMVMVVRMKLGREWLG